jgi:hypothetical protein
LRYEIKGALMVKFIANFVKRTRMLIKNVSVVDDEPLRLLNQLAIIHTFNLSQWIFEEDLNPSSTQFYVCHSSNGDE